MLLPALLPFPNVYLIVSFPNASPNTTSFALPPRLEGLEVNHNTA